MKRVNYPEKSSWRELFRRPSADMSDMIPKVESIMKDVALQGDEALLRYTEKFDGVRPEYLRVTPEEFQSAAKEITTELKEAIAIARNNIERFHNVQHVDIQQVETMPGVKCWRKSVPIEKVGLYIPGGSAPLFSTVLMLATPARLAGCSRVILCTPPDKNGNVHPAILYAADQCGVHEVYKVGGVQAIAAMAYGTETVPAVNKICGPGNAWVTAAKQRLSAQGFPIDMPAGPSELAVYADETVPASFIAADLLSQAEHGPDSQVVVVSTDAGVLDAVEEEVKRQLMDLPRKEIALQALQSSLSLLVRTEEDAMELLNEYAAEHLILATQKARDLSGKVINAGSVFLGAWSPESAGDYASGTNHTLPTNGFAKGWSGVSLDTFLKKITFQEISHDGLLRIGGAVETMAEAEGLFAHRNAVTIRKNFRH